MTNLEEARNVFQNDRFATENGAVISELAEDYAVCTLELENRHRNALGNVMGGAVFMLGDFAFAVASNYGKQPTVSTTSKISFLRAARSLAYSSANISISATISPKNRLKRMLLISHPDTPP